MTDAQDKPTPPENANRLDELLTTIRTALAQDAGLDARSEGAIACRAILGALDPASRPGAPFAPIPTAAANTPTSQPLYVQGLHVPDRSTAGRDRVGPT